jgi:high-affinity iron transporter
MTPIIRLLSSPRLLACALVLSCCPASVQAGRGDDFQQTESRLDDLSLDLVSAPLPPERAGEPGKVFDTLRADVRDPAAVALTQLDPAQSPAAQVGEARARLQHITALEMLRHQQAGRIADAREWRSLITLPRFASGEENAVLLQTNDVAQMQAPAVTRALAREYVGWQVLRARQLLDYLQLGVQRGDATASFLELYSNEIRALVRFPAPLLAAAGLPVEGASKVASQLPTLTEPFDAPANAAPLALWRQAVEGTLPNLLTEQDTARLQRLLARFVKLIPQEYRNGVHEGRVIIALEYREATQFTQQAQALVNELGPVWQRDLPDAYARRSREVVDKFEALRVSIAKKVPAERVTAQAKEIADIMENDFHLSARRAGDRGDVIEETALEVHAALNGSLAAAKADQWQEAESLRLDAYTAFDSEIEPRVLPRDPELGRRVERSFIDGGSPEEPGIKALLDRRAPMDELEAAYVQTMTGLDASVNLLKTSVSATTLSFTAFSIVAREGMEAVVVLAALLAGLRGVEQARTRRGITVGAWLALGATAITFWLSQTLIQSLSHYGEKLEAFVSILAVIILLIVTNWVFHKFYWVGWNAKIRSLSKAAQNVDRQRWEFLALLGVGFLTVYREGFETALFLQSLLLEGNRAAVAVGVAGGLGAILLIGALTFKFGVKLPYRRMLVITGVLVVSIMVSFLGSTTRLFQTVGWLPVHPVPGLHIPAWVGLWLGFYPSWEGILIPPLALVYVGGAWLWTKWQSARAQGKLQQLQGRVPEGPNRAPEPAAA